jgi:hypothetical protein
MRANVVCPGFVHTPLRSRHARGHPSILLGQVRGYGRRAATRDKDPLTPRLETGPRLLRYARNDRASGGALSLRGAPRDEAISTRRHLGGLGLLRLARNAADSLGTGRRCLVKWKGPLATWRRLSLYRMSPTSDCGVCLKGEGQFGGKNAPDVYCCGDGYRFRRSHRRGRGAERPPGARSAGDARRAAGERNPQLRSEPFRRGDHTTRRDRSGNKADPACYRLDNADNSTSGHSGRQPGGQTEIARAGVAAQQRPSKLSCGSRMRISERPKSGTPR